MISDDWKKGEALLEVTKISTKKVSERVVEQIEQWVLSGSVVPGDKLPSVRELCDMFEVGRSAVRDAITTLKGKGIVEVRQGEGAFICHVQTSKIFEDLLFLNGADIDNLYSVRKILEISTAEMAALHRQEHDLDNMKKALYHLEKKDKVNSWEADYAFHIAIAEATQNKVIVQLMHTIATIMKKALIGCHQIISSDQAVGETIFQQHLVIYEAIKEGKPQKARESMLVHLTHVEELLQKSLEA
jgi:GntR family transcriptional repressor for pyruvate dehydrogenase complex